MATQKYYAVLVGRETGVFLTWEECQKNTTGFPGAKFKGFKTNEEAEAYLKQSDANDRVTTLESETNYSDLIKTDLKDSRVVAFVDGSFSDKGGEALVGYGCYIIPPDPNLQHVEISDKVFSQKFLSTRNIAAEIFAALAAIDWAVSNSYNSITIYHDLEHTGKWARKEYNANTEIAKFWVKSLDDKYSDIIDIKFTWVKGHSGVEYNEKADQLASDAIKNQRKPIGKNGPNFFIGKNVTKDKVDHIIEEIKNIENVTYCCEVLTTGGIKNTFTKKSTNAQEKLTVTFHEQHNTTLIQGKVESLFAEFLSRYTAHIPDFDMIRAYSHTYKTTIKHQDIENKIQDLKLPSNYPKSSIVLLKQAYVMLELDKIEYDYTHYVLPAYRALEGHIKYLFEEASVHLSATQSIGSFFKKDSHTGQYYLTAQNLASHSLAAKITAAYNLYNAHRHPALHFGEIIGPIDTTLLIPNKTDAQDRINEVLSIIQF